MLASKTKENIEGEEETREEPFVRTQPKKSYENPTNTPNRENYPSSESLQGPQSPGAHTYNELFEVETCRPVVGGDFPPADI